MRIGESMIPEFDMEMANTRKVLERIPDDKLNWKIHEKSNTIGWVANHLADIPAWVETTIRHDSLDVEPEPGMVMRRVPAGSAVRRPTAPMP